MELGDLRTSNGGNQQTNNFSDIIQWNGKFWLDALDISKKKNRQRIRNPEIGGENI